MKKTSFASVKLFGFSFLLLLSMSFYKEVGMASKVLEDRTNNWAINGPIRVKGKEKLGLTVLNQNQNNNTQIILHEGLNEWVMLSNGAIVLKNNQKLGLTVLNQNLTNGAKIILHEGYNLWTVLSNGAIVLKNNPKLGLTVLNQNLKDNAEIILHEGYNTWTSQIPTTAPTPTPAPPRAKATSRGNWMASVNDNTSIAALSIPGTHDSGADYGSGDFVTSPYAQCQDWSISKQLEEGIRYLDVRCRRMGTVFTIHHGPFYQQKNFGHILNDCKAFLQKNPSETILMRIKEEHDAGPNSESFQAIFRRYKAQYPNIWYSGSTIPNMKTARGKIIILDNASIGEGINFGDGQMQDKYDIGDIDGKWNLIKNHLDKATNGDKNTLYYNHVSATSAPLKSPKDMAEGCNPKVNSYLSLNGKGRYGVIIMDFPTADLINLIINTNGEVTGLPGVNATYRVELDACHSDLTGTGTNGRITVGFYSGSTRVGGKYVDKPGDNCLGADQAFSFTTDKPITKIEISTNSGDGYYIDELRTFKDGVLTAHYGSDNGNGWCLSTDASDATGDWKNYISGTGGKCVSIISFAFFK